MRRLVFPVIMASGLVMAGPSSAFADDPTPTVSVKATPGKKVCKITNTKLDELSGIVATKTGFIVIDDSTDQESHKRVFFLSDKCEITKAVEYSGKGPRDTEDLILSPDGKTLWIADIGDNNYEKTDGSRRDTVSLWKMPADGSSKPTIHRLAYPEGDYHDAEALLLNGDGTPLIVTKEIGKPAYVYEPTKALETGNETGVPLKRVGQITVSATETPGTPLARIGNRSIDGGAVAPGGGKVVLRTYTDALEWDVSGGNVIAALQGKPRVTGLPNEPGGEAITYSPDGKTFYTVSDMNGDHDTANYIMSYVPATTVATVKKSSTSSGSGKSWYSDLTVDQIMYMVGGVGGLGLLLVGIGVVGIVRFRKRQGSAPPADLDDAVDPLAGEPETELIGVGGAPQRAGVYGGARSGPAAGGGGVYGGASGPPAGGGAQRGPVYGSGGAGAAGGGAPQYARPAGGQQPAGNGVYGSGQQPRSPQQGQQRPPQGGQRPPQGGPPQGAPSQGGPPQGAPSQGGPRPAQGGGPRPPQGGPRPPQGGQGQRPPQGGPRPPQGGGQGGPRPAQGGGPRPPQGGPRPPQGGQGQRPPQGGPRPAQGPQQGVYGKPPARPDGQMDRQAYPQGRFDNPDYRQR